MGVTPVPFFATEIISLYIKNYSETLMKPGKFMSGINANNLTATYKEDIQASIKTIV